MTRSDRQRWDRKYRDGNPNPGFAPSELLTKYAHLLPGKGLALDLACGVGHNALFLADRGHDVIGVDGSVAGLRYCREALGQTGRRLHLIAADLDRFPLPAATFDVVIVFRFLDRSLIPEIKQTLAPGGLLMYETFNTNQLLAAPRMNRAYLLEPGELATWFNDFDTVATNDDRENATELSHWIGRRPG